MTATGRELQHQQAVESFLVMETQGIHYSHVTPENVSGPEALTSGPPKTWLRNFLDRLFGGAAANGNGTPTLQLFEDFGEGAVVNGGRRLLLTLVALDAVLYREAAELSL